MPNPAAVAYEAYRKYLHESGTTEFYLLPFKELSDEHKAAWWAVVRALVEIPSPPL